MNDYVINTKLSEMNSAINGIKADIESIRQIVKPENELWDSSDIIRNWKVSERTLAEWRRRKMIGYVQISKKIYYPREERDKFLQENLKEGGDYES